MTDGQIIELVKNHKSEKAFTVLYKHFPKIRKMVITNGGGGDDAQDIYQEALIILYRKIIDADFKLSAQLSTYLYSVCRYLWRDELRKREKHQMFKMENTSSVEEENSLQEAFEKEKDIKLAETIVNELGDRCRELLLLFYSGTMRLKAIAEKMGYSSEGTAKNQKYKCLEAAKNKLREIKQQTATKNI